MRLAVVGHIEWVQFAAVKAVPRPGEIVHASSTWEAPAGGGAVAAVQLARLAGAPVDFFTALGDDTIAARARAGLTELGLTVHAVARNRPQRRAFTHVDANGERTITVLGDRLVPAADDPLPWDELAQADAVYLTGGDAGAARAARRARVLVATPRAAEAVAAGGVELDALVLSDGDATEAVAAATLQPPPRLTVYTQGGHGGRYQGAEGATGTFAVAELPGPVADAYGCGDSFAAGLTYGLGAGLAVPDALALAARCGAWCLTGHGPYQVQLRGPV